MTVNLKVWKMRSRRKALLPFALAFILSTVLSGIASAAERGKPLEFGVCFHHAEEYNKESAKVLQDLRSAGPLWIRGDFGKVDKDKAFAADMEKQGIKVLALLYWYKKSPKGWREYVQNCVKAAPQAPAWEICNEPEMSWWGGPISTKDYMCMLKEAHQIIRKSGSKALIIGPAVGATAEGLSYLKKLIDSGLLNYVDAISVHYYIFHKNTDIAGVKNLLKGRKPIWITETGWTTADQRGAEKAQAEYLRKYYDRKSGILGSDPAIDLIFNYELNDDHYPCPKGKDDGWGLSCGAKSGFRKKAAYTVFKSLIPIEQP